MRIRTGLLAALAILLANAAQAETLSFTGTTTADTVVARDVLKQVQILGLGVMDCGVIGAVEADLMPTDFKPAGLTPNIDGAPETYERWIISLCGKRLPLLITFWLARQGGVMFRVTHPFPAAAARR